MSLQPALPQFVCKAFFAALLLTTNEREAELAVTEAIETALPESNSTRQFLIAAVKSALGIVRERKPRSSATGIALPSELKAIVDLPNPLRQCFVLQVLLRIEENRCVELLHIDKDSVASFTAAALMNLAGVPNFYAEPVQRVVSNRQ